MNKDLKIGGVLIIFSIVDIFLIIPSQIGPLGSDQTIFPLLENILLLLVSIFIVWGNISSKKKLNINRVNKRISPPKSEFNKVLFCTAIVGIYVFTVEFIGYLIMTPLCLILGMIYFKVRRKWFMVLTTLIVTLGMYFLFKVALRADLPMGVLSGIFYY